MAGLAGLEVHLTHQAHLHIGCSPAAHPRGLDVLFPLMMMVLVVVVVVMSNYEDIDRAVDCGIALAT